MTTTQKLAEALRRIVDTGPGGKDYGRALHADAVRDGIIALAEYDASVAGPKVGDTVRVINPYESFGDYAVGSLARVRSLGTGYNGKLVCVDWLHPFHNNTSRDNARADVLYLDEIEIATTGAQNNGSTTTQPEG